MKFGCVYILMCSFLCVWRGGGYCLSFNSCAFFCETLLSLLVVAGLAFNRKSLMEPV